MTLTLRAVSLDDAPLTQPITAYFNRAGGTIGRSDRNTMALPDPERYISRQHARISARGTDFIIQNIGSSNPISVGQRTLAQGESTDLRHNDWVRIGGYLLHVIDVSVDDEHDAATVEPKLVNHGHAKPSLRREESRPLSPDNPFASLIGLAEQDTSPPRTRPGRDEEDSPRLPSNFNPLEPRRTSAVPGPKPFEDLVPDDEGVSIDDLLCRDPLPEPRVEQLADRVPELLAAFVPPRVMPTPAAAPPLSPPEQEVDMDLTQAMPLHPPANADGQALWSAFCKGAGVSLDAPGGPSTEVMTQAGVLLRLAIEGTLQLMALRSTTRHELRATVTTIRPRDNNPLKFSPDAGSALERLLQPPSRGFLPGSAAMADAMGELVGHTIGTMAGTRAALESVLGRFAPDELEARLDAKGLLDRVLPMTRKSRLWELYLQHYGSIRDAAQEDFHAVFGKAFLAAYEQQVERLRRERAARAG